MELVYSILGALFGVVFIVLGFLQQKRVRLISETPRSKIRSMAMGFVEVHGQAHADTYLVAPFSQSECVYYRYEIQEYRIRASGSKSSSTSSWVTIAQGKKSVPFFVKDETGSVLVDAQGAEFHVNVHQTYIQRGGFFGASKSFVDAVRSWEKGESTPLDITQMNLEPLASKAKLVFYRGGDRRILEFCITPQSPLFVLGTCGHDDQNNPVIKKGEFEKTFIIGDKSEKDMLKNFRVVMWVLWILGALILVGSMSSLLFSSII